MLMLVLDAPEDFVVAETMHCYDQCSRQLPGFVQFDLTIENISTSCYTIFGTFAIIIRFICIHNGNKIICLLVEETPRIHP